MNSAMMVNEHHQVIYEHGVSHFQLDFLFLELGLLHCLPYVADSHNLPFLSPKILSMKVGHH